MKREEDTTTWDSVPKGDYVSAKQTEIGKTIVQPDVTASISEYRSERNLRIESSDFSDKDSVKFHIDVGKDNKRRSNAKLNDRFKRINRR